MLGFFPFRKILNGRLRGYRSGGTLFFWEVKYVVVEVLLTLFFNFLFWSKEKRENFEIFPSWKILDEKLRNYESGSILIFWEIKWRVVEMFFLRCSLIFFFNRKREVKIRDFSIFLNFGRKIKRWWKYQYVNFLRSQVSGCWNGPPFLFILVVVFWKCRIKVEEITQVVIR